SAHARVEAARRQAIVLNHSATHLLHAALRQVLGEHVHQAGSLVTPDRLRFDFTHHGPVKPEQLREIEAWVNRAVWASIPVAYEEKGYQDAVAEGAMALFGEKYGDTVRVVSIPGLSMELCGGTHVSNTAQIGLLTIVSESGVAAGVRRIEALTGRRAYEHLRGRERLLVEAAEMLKSPADQLPRRVQALMDERRTLERRLDEVMRGGGGDQVRAMIDEASDVDGVSVVARFVPAADAKMLQSLGDALREQMTGGVAVLGSSSDERGTLLAVVSDDVRETRGLRADVIVREVAALVGGRGGGKPHMAQGGVPDAARVPEALDGAVEVVRRLVGSGA
ncbi:MAG TPA: DHHA1 domain-containing protein, partial [Gemmatimonadaceae bacterium]|nr:DHHA1 domain-containing protein [Gemmatimonadaceae bacterium]